MRVTPLAGVDVGTARRLLRHPYDLVALADAVVRDDRDTRSAWPGRAPRARARSPSSAVELGRAADRPRLARRCARVRSGVASRPETWIRLTLVDAGCRSRTTTSTSATPRAVRRLRRSRLPRTEDRHRVRGRPPPHGRGSVGSGHREARAPGRAGWRVDPRHRRQMVFANRTAARRSGRRALRERALTPHRPFPTPIAVDAPLLRCRELAVYARHAGRVAGVWGKSTGRCAGDGCRGARLRACSRS